MIAFHVQMNTFYFQLRLANAENAKMEKFLTKYMNVFPAIKIANHAKKRI